MINLNKINLNKNEEKEWTPCPPYNGLACIVDATEMKSYETKFGKKDKFRLLIELCIPKAETPGRNWVVATMPMTPSTYEMAALAKFCKSIGVDCTTKDFSLSQLAGKYLNVIVEHVDVEGKTFANITYTGKAPAGTKFTSTYVPAEPKVKTVATASTTIAPSAEQYTEYFAGAADVAKK